jgi:hypothetical protein
MKELDKIGCGILAVAIRATVALSLAFGLAGCDKLLNCYDATFVGSNGYYMAVAEKSSGKKREMHTYNSDYYISKVGAWKFGDELVVCNDFVTNKTRNDSAPCSGCLVWWWF